MMNHGNLQAATAALETQQQQQQHQQIAGSGIMAGPQSSASVTNGGPLSAAGATGGAAGALAPRAPPPTPGSGGLGLAGQQQQQHQQQLHHPGGPTASSASASSTSGVPAHLIGLMTNPSLAAAAAASPLFPPAALLSNPGAYLSMPDAYAAGAMQAAAAAAAAASRQQQQQHSSTHPFSLHANGGAGPNSSGGGNVLTQASLSGMNPFLVGMPTTSLPLPTMSSSVDLSSALLDGGRKLSMGGGGGSASTTVLGGQGQMIKSGNCQLPPHHLAPGSSAGPELTVEERQQQNRDRNREHARSTRLRKKAYVAKLKELVEGLHAERTEEVRQRRIAIQSLSEMQNVRRTVVRSFLRYYAAFEVDERKWGTLLEEKFSLKQPVTPYRSFRSSEIEKAHHYSRGLPSLLSDAASLSVMIESIGSKSPRWMQRKREELMQLEAAMRGSKNMPSCVVRQDSRLHHAISSLSSSSGSSNHASSSGEEGGDAATNNRIPSSGEGHANLTSSNGRYLRPMLGMLGRHEATANVVGSTPAAQGTAASGAAKVSSSSGSGSSSNDSRAGGSNNNSKPKHDASNDFHDYHAQPLDDPEPALLDSDRNSSTSADDESPAESNLSENTETKRITTDSSSGDDSATTAAAEVDPPAHKRRKIDGTGSSSSRLSAGEAAMLAATPHAPSTHPAAPTLSLGATTSIAKKGGIPHNIKTTAVASERGVVANGAARLGLVAPAVPLRPFAGIGKARKRGNDQNNLASAGKNGVLSENDTSTVSSSSSIPQIRVSFHINEDDMILMDDVLMCPFTFRTQDAVICGALSECVMPGMLRAQFSERNKLLGLELVYDAMGFMQQLERASGREGAAQVIPSTLEMALSPTASDARVITTAKSPFQIVNVNDVWTQITGYTQMEVEGEPYLSLMEGDGTVPQANERQGKPKYDLEEVAKGRSACTANIHYDKAGNDFMEYVCSYPLTNSSGEVTHLLHVSSELPSYHGTLMDQ